MAIRAFHAHHNPPLEQLIRETMDRFYNTFTLHDNKSVVKRRIVRVQPAINDVQRSVHNDQNVTIRHRARQLNVCTSTL